MGGCEWGSCRAMRGWPGRFGRRWLGTGGRQGIVCSHWLRFIWSVCQIEHKPFPPCSDVSRPRFADQGTIMNQGVGDEGQALKCRRSASLVVFRRPDFAFMNDHLRRASGKIHVYASRAPVRARQLDTVN